HDRPIALDVGSLQKNLVLSAVASSEGNGDAFELLPLRKNGVVFEPGAAGPVRLRLFFSLLPNGAGSQIERGRASTRAGGASTAKGVVENAEKRPDVELKATASRARPAQLRTMSSV
ncbi:MAG: hypothetical protein AAGG01_12450, partial [Planctomycetota bacterium]